MSNGSNARSALIVRGLVWAGAVASLLSGGWGLHVWSSARSARTPEALGALGSAPSLPIALLLGGLALGLALTPVLFVLLGCALVDRTELKRRRATTALAASEARYRGLLETAPDPVVVMDRYGVLLFANDRTEQVFGYPREELIGQAVGVLLPERSRASHRRQLEAYMLAPEIRSVGQELSLRGRRKDGSELPVEVSLSPSLTPEGLRVTAIIRDVTEREQYVSRQQDAHRELECLQQEYVGIISHDLRNPLQVIALRTHMLQRMLEEKGLSHEAKIAGALLQNTQRMGSMVEELLDNSRLEAGQVELRWQPTDLARFLAEVLERDLPPDARERFQLKVSEAPPVPVDPPRLERVLVNLLTNALKYSRPGTLITVRLERTEAHVEISVQDQGQGLRPEDTARLFQKYYRTHEGRMAQGVGLGLYISRLIIEAHGGRIRVASNPGQGSIFTLSLPLKPVAREELAAKLGAA